MTKHSDDVPETYLNKGQVYTISVVDTHNPCPNTVVRYRTSIRISFEDEQQRAKPAACWQLWKEGRGTNEAHIRGGRLQAVEYVGSGQGAGAGDASKASIELTHSSPDGFSVEWTPPAGALECPISVRFNFLSTDFSRFKGVKGIPVRLCAKTEAISDPPTAQGQEPELCYARAKLFRDHGAERKLSNDVAHVKKTIYRLGQQIAQSDAGLRHLGKRKHESVTRAGGLEGPIKIAKQGRTWSTSSSILNGMGGNTEEDLHLKRMTLEEMFRSTRPVSVLYLRGTKEDDPDLFPVRILGDIQAPNEIESGELSTIWAHGTPESEVPPRLISPSADRQSLTTAYAKAQQPAATVGVSRVNSSERQVKPSRTVSELSHLRDRTVSPFVKQSITIQSPPTETRLLSRCIEALVVDVSYQSPAEHRPKPAACYYIRSRVAWRTLSNEYYRAIYPTQSTLHALVNAIAQECSIDPDKVLRVVRVSSKGLTILFDDDDCLRQLREGQDMVVEINETHSPRQRKAGREWAAQDSTSGAGIAAPGSTITRYELKIFF